MITASSFCSPGYRKPGRRLLHFLIAGVFAAGVVSAQTGSITIDTNTPGLPIPPTLFGVFFEEINLAGDGGLYGELVRNRSFNNSANPDFWTVVAEGTTGWGVRSGTWGVDTSVSPAAYAQTATGTDCRSTFSAPGSNEWQDYTLTLQAWKLGGSEGFLIMFNVADTDDWFWWNLGGWNNTAHAVEYSIAGVKATGDKVSGSIATDQWYDIKIAIEGGTVNCYLDNELKQTFTLGSGFAGSIGLSTWNTQAEFRNIVVTGADSQVLYQSDFDASGATAWQVNVDTSNPLNATNADALKLTLASATGSLGAANSGYWGIPLQAGAAYNLSLFAAASDGFTGPLTARLESADGSIVHAQTDFSGLTAGWQQFTATLTPATADPSARLVLSIAQPGTVWLDVVSLMPHATYRNRSNGMRPDLAGALAAMKPSFLRFPGGCYVEGNTLANAFRWKNSIGPISGRPGHWNLWGYTSTDGLGYHEYLQFCEDLGAAPVFCINAGISHSDVVPLDQMGEYVQDALDAIEYANGDAGTPWGAQRAANGHPEPFNLQFIEIGNENGGSDYNDRYALFHDAIKAAYPQMRLIACNWGGTPTSRPLDIVDEHYYSSATTFLSYATKYDSYSRSGPKVFVGEFAVTSGYGTFGNLSAALGEAAFMTGMERNCDVVTMASYAPLFANVNMMTWKPDAIYFDNSRFFGTPSYHVQKMFANNMGTVLLPMSQDFSPGFAGSIGLSTWNTQAEFRNIVVTGADSQVLYQSDFDAAGTAGWDPASGTWGVDSSVSPAAYAQTATGTDRRSTYTAAGSSAWQNYTLTLQARKLGGDEGFLVMFNVADTDDWFWWNLGGWGNTAHAVESSIAGAKATGPRVAGSVNTGQWYDIKIAIHGGKVDCYLDDVLTQTFTFPAPVHSVASMQESTREIILKSVNPTSGAITANIVLQGATAVAPTAQKTVLTSGSPDDENSLAAPDNVVPVESSATIPGTEFALELPAYSLTILRVQALAAAPQDLTATAGNQQAAIGWSPAAGATSYTVKRAIAIDGPYAVIASGLSDTSFTDTGLANGTTYFYVVVAVNAAGESASAGAVAVTPVLPPVADQELVAPGISVDGDTVRILVAFTVSGRVYTLQRSDDLQSGTWQDTGASQTGAGGELVFTDLCDSSILRRFYRVKLTSE